MKHILSVFSTLGAGLVLTLCLVSVSCESTKVTVEAKQPVGKRISPGFIDDGRLIVVEPFEFIVLGENDVKEMLKWAGENGYGDPDKTNAKVNFWFTEEYEEAGPLKDPRDGSYYKAERYRLFCNAMSERYGLPASYNYFVKYPDEPDYVVTDKPDYVSIWTINRTAMILRGEGASIEEICDIIPLGYRMPTKTELIAARFATGYQVSDIDFVIVRTLRDGMEGED